MRGCFAVDTKYSSAGHDSPLRLHFRGVTCVVVGGMRARKYSRGWWCLAAEKVVCNTEALGGLAASIKAKVFGDFQESPEAEEEFQDYCSVGISYDGGNIRECWFPDGCSDSVSQWRARWRMIPALKDSTAVKIRMWASSMFGKWSRTTWATLTTCSKPKAFISVFIPDGLLTLSWLNIPQGYGWVPESSTAPKYFMEPSWR